MMPSLRPSLEDLTEYANNAKANGISRKQAAEEFGVSRSTYAKWLESYKIQHLHRFERKAVPSKTTLLNVALTASKTGQTRVQAAEALGVCDATYTKWLKTHNVEGFHAAGNVVASQVDVDNVAADTVPDLDDYREATHIWSKLRKVQQPPCLECGPKTFTWCRDNDFDCRQFCEFVEDTKGENPWSFMGDDMNETIDQETELLVDECCQDIEEFTDVLIYELDFEEE
jgi:transposase